MRPAKHVNICTLTIVAGLLLWPTLRPGILEAQDSFAARGGIIDPSCCRPIFVEHFDSADPGAANRLQSWLLLGFQNGWHGHLANNAYRLSNMGNPQQVNYFFTAMNRECPPDCIAEVHVKVDPHPGTNHSGAGLIYASHPSGDIWHAFVLQRHGRYVFLRKDAAGFRVLRNGQTAGLRPYAFNTLSVRGLPAGGVELLINKRHVDTLHDAVAGFSGGRIGLIAVSSGKTNMFSNGMPIG